MREVSSKRWNEAQEYEKFYWKNIPNSTLKNDYLEGSKKVKLEIQRITNLSKQKKVLQIGCGPEDVIHHWGGKNNFAVDPLVDFFKKRKLLKHSGVKMQKAVGESLPYTSNYFDIILLINVLDHVQDPQKVINEVRRCLKKGGIFYIRTNVRSIILLPLLKLIWKTKFSTAKGHPHLFLERNIDSLLINGNLEIIKSWATKPKFNWKIFFSIRKFAQFLIEYNYTCICQKY